MTHWEGRVSKTGRRVFSLKSEPPRPACLHTDLPREVAGASQRVSKSGRPRGHGTPSSSMGDAIKHRKQEYPIPRLREIIFPGQ
jgi:hypothetical protein